MVLRVVRARLGENRLEVECVALFALSVNPALVLLGTSVLFVNSDHLGLQGVLLVVGIVAVRMGGPHTSPGVASQEVALVQRVSPSLGPFLALLHIPLVVHLMQLGVVLQDRSTAHSLSWRALLTLTLLIDALFDGFEHRLGGGPLSTAEFGVDFIALVVDLERPHLRIKHHFVRLVCVEDVRRAVGRLFVQCRRRGLSSDLQSFFFQTPPQLLEVELVLILLVTNRIEVGFAVAAELDLDEPRRRQTS